MRLQPERSCSSVRRLDAVHRTDCAVSVTPGRWRWRYISRVASPELPVRFGAYPALGRTWKEDHEHCSHASLTPKRPPISPASRFFAPALDTTNHKNKM
jgi:hypothetical protein